MGGLKKRLDWVVVVLVFIFWHYEPILEKLYKLIGLECEIVL